MGTGPRQEYRMGGTVPARSRCLQNVLNVFLGTGVMTRPGVNCRPGVGCPGKPNFGKSVSQRWPMLRPALPAGLAEDRSRRQQDVLSQRELQCCAPARGGTWTKESAPCLSLQQIFSLLPNKLQHLSSDCTGSCRLIDAFS